MKLVHQYMAIFFNFPPTASHLRPLQVLVVDEDDNGQLFRLERVKAVKYCCKNHGEQQFEIITNVLLSSFVSFEYLCYKPSGLLSQLLYFF